MPNALNVIHPYRWEGLWVFDDARTGLEREPFVEGADILIDQAVAAKSIRDAAHGFRLWFSACEFPRHDFVLRWLREGEGGNWYHSHDFGVEAWLCPALLKYFDQAPPEIYVRIEARGPAGDAGAA
jgi:hypothetical protein